MTRSDPRGGDVRYFVRFAVTSLVLVAVTLVLVLVVLPQRYVLSAGFRESGLNFPRPTTPFAPRDPIRVAALAVPPAADLEIPTVVMPGPGEVLWSRVLPLLEDERYEVAVPLFEAYLRAHPGDDDVRRELAAALNASGRESEAVPVVQELLARADDPELRLALARSLRDQGRLQEAAAQYATLHAARPRDEALALEWARSLSWAERYADAEEVLRAALVSVPRSVPLRVELARVRYYADDLAGASDLLEPMSESDLAAADGVALRTDVRAALAEPPAIEAPPPTLLERAVAAREADDFANARALFAAAVLERPEDAETWRAYADLLEYELSDFEGARAALLEVERLGGADAALQYRLALLESWTGRGDAALARLGTLLGVVTAAAAGEDAPAAPTAADVHALMGDLHRWDERRIEAGSHYLAALEIEPSHERAGEGLEDLRLRIGRLIEEVEGPGFGGLALGAGDTDDFGRVDLGGEWTGVDDAWSWAGAVGQRWLSGRSPVVAGPAGTAGDLTGTFVEVTPARWWRWGTVRTAIRLGAEWVRDDEPDFTIGASVELRPVDGGVLTVDVGHDPAYGLTSTLQSARADVTRDRVLVAWSQPVGERWSVSGQADASRLVTHDVPGADASTRLSGALAVSRAMSPLWSLGWSAGAVGYTTAAPAPDGLRLYWDPALAVSTGPTARLGGRLDETWEASLGASPGLALIDERTPAGLDVVPQLALDARLGFSGARLSATLDLFYAQARLEGYRSYGARVTLGSASWSSRGPPR